MLGAMNETDLCPSCGAYWKCDCVQPSGVVSFGVGAFTGGLKLTHVTSTMTTEELEAANLYLDEFDGTRRMSPLTLPYRQGPAVDRPARPA